MKRISNNTKGGLLTLTRVKRFVERHAWIKPLLHRAKSTLDASISNLDYAASIVYANLNRHKLQEEKILLMPAASISGGFGEDVMVAGFLNGIGTKPVTLIADKIESRRYLRANTKYVELAHDRFKYLRIAQYLKMHTDVYVIGADILDGIYESNRLRFRTLYLAHKMKVCTHITGFSVRENSSLYFIKSIKKVSKYTQIMARDVLSFQRLRQYVPNVKQTVDIAFLCGSPSVEECRMDVIEWASSEKRKGKRVVAYCPNTIQAQKMGLNEYICAQRVLLSKFVEEGCCILFLYHDLRKYALGINDEELSRMVYCFFQNDGVFVPDIPDGYSLKAYLQLADFTLTGRMHFGISGYTVGIPMFGISYFGKFEGLQLMFGIDTSFSIIYYDNVEANIDVICPFLSFLTLFLEKVKPEQPRLKNLAVLNLL